MKDKKSKLQNISSCIEGIIIAIIYCLLSMAWVYYSDTALYKAYEGNIELYIRLRTIKAYIFILISTILIFLLTYYRVNKLRKKDMDILKNTEEHNKKMLEVLKLENKIYFLDSHDLITGLPNRMSLEKAFNKIRLDSLNKYENLALLYIDINNFKNINETVGHFGGDQFLIHVGEIIKDNTSRSDLVGRISQDEFVVILRGIGSKEDINEIIKAIENAIKEPWVFDDEVFYNSVAIGIATYPEDGDGFIDLLRKANMACEYAKTLETEDFSYYTEGIGKQQLNNIKILNDISTALINDEFSLNYQVVYNLKEDSIEGVEALIRWNHPTEGYISPGEFIPIAEKTSLMYEIADFVVNEAFRQKNQWNYNGVNCKQISINISAKTFSRNWFPGLIKNGLKMYGLKSEEIILELTESVFAEDMADIEKNVRILRRLGLKIALDDFGTGYSALSRLKDLNIDFLKMDKSFITNLEKDSGEALMVKSVIDLSQDLGIKVVAEGIETKEQYDILKSMGCDLGQGYYIDKPKTSYEVEDTFENIPTL